MEYVKVTDAEDDDESVLLHEDREEVADIVTEHDDESVVLESSEMPHGAAIHNTFFDLDFDKAKNEIIIDITDEATNKKWSLRLNDDDFPDSGRTLRQEYGSLGNAVQMGNVTYDYPLNRSLDPLQVTLADGPNQYSYTVPDHRLLSVALARSTSFDDHYHADDSNEARLHAQPGSDQKAKRLAVVNEIVATDVTDVKKETEVRARIYDRDQKIPDKVHSQDEQVSNEIDPTWKYNITIGDIELKRIFHYDGKEETLWFPMEQYPDDYDEKHKSKKPKKKAVPPRKVFVALKIKRVSDVDNIRETFRMRFHFYFNWLPSESDYKAWYKAKRESEKRNNPQLLMDWEPKWYPHLEFQNMIKQHAQGWELYPEEGHFRMQQFSDFGKEKGEIVPEGQRFDCDKAMFIRAKLECEMTFAEELELESFPFDCQDLTCAIQERTTGDVRCIFLPELRKKQFGSIDLRYSVVDEWDIQSALLEFGDADPGASRSKSSYAMIVIRLKIKRRWKVFFANTVFLSACIALLGLTAFSLGDDHLADRLNLLITLILTAVAFSYVVFDSLPRVPYLTFMDKYILGNYGFLVTLMMVSSCMRQEWYTDTFDAVMFGLYCVWFFVYHLAMGYYGYRLRQEECKKLVYSTDDVEMEVNLTRPGLRFDYTKRLRAGKNGRLLSYIGTTHISQYMNEEQKAIVQKKQSEMTDLYERHSYRHGYNGSLIPSSSSASFDVGALFK